VYVHTSVQEKRNAYKIYSRKSRNESLLGEACMGGEFAVSACVLDQNIRVF
jgi:hypothetical protein